MAGNKTGMEAMLRAMGMGEVLDAANQLAQSGAINHVIAFANAVGPIREQLNRIEAKLDAIGLAAGSSSPDGGAWSDYDWAGLDGAGRQSSTGGATSGRVSIGADDSGPIIEGVQVREVAR